MNQIEKPRKRTALRIYLGTKYFTLKRYMKWYFSGIKFAGIKNEILTHKISAHQTPLIRNLRDVDMYLQTNKVVNLRIAALRLNNLTIYPGETFSYWKAIGKPTKRKGYIEGMVLNNGSFTAKTGGGLCQLSNLIYWMTIHTPLTVAERHRHSYDVFPDSNRTQPFGSGATCFYNYKDLIIYNGTDQAFQLHINVGSEYLCGEWTSNTGLEYHYEVYEKEHIMQPEMWGGYTRHNVLYRKKLDSNNNLLEDEYVVENHAIMMYSPFIENKGLS